MNPCGYGLDQTIRAVDVQKILRPQLNNKDKSGKFGIKHCRDFLVSRVSSAQKNFAVPFCCGNGKTFFPSTRCCGTYFSGNWTF
jgi:hypothetical protein